MLISHFPVSRPGAVGFSDALFNYAGVLNHGMMAFDLRRLLLEGQDAIASAASW